MSKEYSGAIKKHSILKVENGSQLSFNDMVVVEEPLELQIRYFSKGKWVKRSLAVTMRTPGSDKKLAIGFLFSEGIIGRFSDITSIDEIESNMLVINLLETVLVEMETLERNFYATSSCGVCGKTSIDKLAKTSCFFPQPTMPKIAAVTLTKLPFLLRNIQSLFDQTGGIHAAAIFSPSGKLITFSEDVGRHNAVDKLIGNCLQKGQIPLRKEVLLLSGRISFELVQKAMMVGIPIIAAVGAPSSLAIELAEEAGITLIGFLKADRFNIYCGEERLRGKGLSRRKVEGRTEQF